MAERERCEVVGMRKLWGFLWSARSLASRRRAHGTLRSYAYLVYDLFENIHREVQQSQRPLPRLLFSFE